MRKLCLLFFVFVLILSGCGGGGGGGGGGGLTTTIFTDWSSVNPPEIVKLTGLSQDTEFKIDPDDPPFVITDYGVSTGATATVKYRADGSIERIDVNTPYIDLTWNEAAGDIISNDGPMIFAGDPNVLKFGVFFNPLEMPPADAWEYQTFGAWADARPIAAGAVGALSVGTPTPGNAIPLLGNATFTGHSAGIYTISSGTAVFVTESAVTVDANFLDRELAFRTTGTTLLNIEDGKQWGDSQVGPPPTLDITSVGPLRYDPGVNRFTGDVSAPGLTGLTGKTTGQFYGPAAEELGGVFSLTGADGREHYSGAYGAAK